MSMESNVTLGVGEFLKRVFKADSGSYQRIVVHLCASTIEWHRHSSG